MKLLQRVKEFFADIKKDIQQEKFIPSYRVVEIRENELNEYTVVVQVINKSFYFYSKPEELLADDKIVDQFSPRDIRALTYLGYLGVHGPKYTILAKKLAEGSDRFVFALKRRGEKNIITKTAEQILNEKEIIKYMDPEDAKTIGYTVAAEDILEEKKQKEHLLRKLHSHNNGYIKQG